MPGLTKYRAKTNFEMLRAANWRDIGFVWFGPNATQSELVGVIRNTCTKLAKEQEIPINNIEDRLLRARAGNTGVMYFIGTTKAGDALDLILEVPEVPKCVVAHGGNAFKHLNLLMGSEEERKFLVLNWQDGLLSGTSVGNKDVIQLGYQSFAQGKKEDKRKSASAFKRHFGQKDLKMVFSIAPKKPEWIRREVCECFGDSQVVLAPDPEFAGSPWEKAILLHPQAFQQSEVADEVLILEEFRAAQNRSYMALSGVEAAHDAINNNSVDKVLISEDLTAVRDVYRSNDEDEITVIRMPQAHRPEMLRKYDIDYEWASSTTYLHWLQSCDPWEVRGQVVIVTEKSGSGRRFMDEVGMAVILRK